MAARRMLLVHAHPDDETITTGATMAHYAAAGAEVTLLTCTLGEEGEILAPEYEQLDAARADQLGGLRIGELAAATAALGVADHRFLGGAGRFRDSGMLGVAANRHPRAFWRAATEPEVFDEAVTAVTEVIHDVRPQVIITYDPNGDYGHPDHVMAHRVTTAAVSRTGGRAKLYWVVTAKAALRAALAAAAAEPGLPFEAVDDLPYGVTEDEITAVIAAPDQLEAKVRALVAHRTQVAVHGRFFALSNGIGRAVSAVEHYRLVHGAAAAPFDSAGRETDLFAGVA